MSKITPLVREVEETGNGAAAPVGATDPFEDLESLRLGQDFESLAGVKKAITVVPIRKPFPQDFIRVHPDPAYWLETMVLETKEDREVYFVDPHLWSALAHELSPRVLFTVVNRLGAVTLWPIRRPGPDGRLDSWSESATQIARTAMGDWVRLQANQSLRGYDCYVAPAGLPEPQWPATPFKELLRIAFRGRVIRDLDHALLRKLRGEV